MSPSGVATATSQFVEARERLAADLTVGGEAFARRATELTDRWLAVVVNAALLGAGTDGSGLAVVALGGYGRRELCPGSDLDLLVVHDGVAGVEEVAEAIWYPMWDSGLRLGHAVRSVGEVVDAMADVESATAMLDARLLRGDTVLFETFTRRVAERWDATLPRARGWLRSDVTDRRERAGDVAFRIEPNVKVAHGGLRDAQVLGWLVPRTEAPEVELLREDDARRLRAAAATLFEVRVALHRVRPASGDVLGLDAQDAVAALLGDADSTALRGRVAAAGRTIAWVLEEAWASSEPGRGRRRRRGRARRAVRAVQRRGTQDDVAAAEPAGEPATALDTAAEVLAVAAQAAVAGRRLGREVLAEAAEALVDPVWDADATDALLELLAAGSGLVGVVESLDRVGVWGRLVPEWDAVRDRPPRTAHQATTDDRRLLDATVLAAAQVGRVADPDALVVAALLHGLDGAAADAVLDRLDADAIDVDRVRRLITQRTLLVDTAMRRDVGDPTVLDAVAAEVGSVEALGLLVALTEAIARATGPQAWDPSRAERVTTLAQRVAWRLQGDRSEQYGRVFPSVEQMLLLRAGETTVHGEGDRLTVVAPDRPGLFSRVAGVLVLRGLDVVAAEATSSDGMALEEFTVASAFATESVADAVIIDWPRVVGDVHRAMAGRLAIEARVAERAATYHRRGRSADSEVRLHFDDGLDGMTVLEVDAPDGVGVLYRITRAFAEVGVDIRSARIETRTDRVVDAFSIVDLEGAAITDASHRAEIERAVRHAASR